MPLGACRADAHLLLCWCCCRRSWPCAACCRWPSACWVTRPSFTLPPSWHTCLRPFQRCAPALQEVRAAAAAGSWTRRRQQRLSVVSGSLAHPLFCCCCCVCAAAVTFVALGNGAPDLSANIAAISAGEVVLSAGALTGAAMFVQVRRTRCGAAAAHAPAAAQRIARLQPWTLAQPGHARVSNLLRNACLCLVPPTPVHAPAGTVCGGCRARGACWRCWHQVRRRDAA
jgi:hypothetical protein